ncbi:hypothetical protein VCV18_012122 [Metarhizium anisopliae]
MGISTVPLPSPADFSLTAEDGQMYEIQVSWSMEWRSGKGHDHVAVPDVTLLSCRQPSSD